MSGQLHTPATLLKYALNQTSLHVGSSMTCQVAGLSLIHTHTWSAEPSFCVALIENELNWSVILALRSRYHPQLLLKVEVICVVAPCSVMVGYYRFGGPCCLYLQGEVATLTIELTDSMEQSPSQARRPRFKTSPQFLFIYVLWSKFI
jgi:hypothetical protein